MMPELPKLPVKNEMRENVLGEVLWEEIEGPYTSDDMRSYALSYGALVEQKVREECAKDLREAADALMRSAPQSPCPPSLTGARYPYRARPSGAAFGSPSF